jgi:uncharacterized protein
MKEKRYQERTYRRWSQSKDLYSFQASILETDLMISAIRELQQEAMISIQKHRKTLQEYICINPAFETSLAPLSEPENIPEIIQQMYRASAKAQVGPFAAVAGAVAEFVGKDLLEHSPEIIVENGGDIFIQSQKERIIGVYAGNSPLTGRIGIVIPASRTPLGICTSSGTVGHSTNFGKADAVVIISQSTALADAVATATANRIQTTEDLPTAIEFARSLEEVLGVIAIIGNQVGVQGTFEIIQI